MYILINSLFFDVILSKNIFYFFTRYMKNCRNFSINLLIASIRIGRNCLSLIIGLITALISVIMELRMCMSI
jgi:hypothetical protein